jgi:hypothetical protein
MSEETAGTGICCTHQEKTRGETYRTRSPRDDDPPVFQGLSEGLQNGSPEFGHLIEKQDSSVSKSDLSRSRTCSSSDKTHMGDCVVRSSEWRAINEPVDWGKEAGNTVDGGYFHGLFSVQTGENTG